VCPESLCGATFAEFENLVTHLTKRSRSAGYCVLCTPYAACNPVINHIRSHLPPTVRCPEEGCDYIATAINLVQKHLRSHRGEHRSYSPVWECPSDPCVQTRVRFLKKSELQQHHSDVHGTPLPEERVECECGKSFTAKKGLKKHQEEYCKVSRTAADTLKQHACPEPDCPRLFYSYDSMRDHYRSVHQFQKECLEIGAMAGVVIEPAGQMHQD